MPCIPLFEENEGAIQIAKHPISNSNSKHIDVRHHFLREFVMEILAHNQYESMLSSTALVHRRSS